MMEIVHRQSIPAVPSETPLLWGVPGAATGLSTQLGPKPCPDAEIFRLRGQHLRLTAELETLEHAGNEAQERDASDDELDALEEAFEAKNAEVCVVVAAIARIPALTMSGLVAQARVAAAMLPHSVEDNHSPGIDEVGLLAVLAGVLRLGGEA